MIRILILLLLLPPVYAETHALLIGIGDYQLPDISKLNGPAQDIILVGTFLKSRHPQAKITTLLDQDADYQGIVTALEKLSQEAEKDDEVWIYFSGHGSQQQDQNGDEGPNGKDSTWVTYGEKTNGIYQRKDLIDDELNYYLANIRSEQLVLISDSCHSGSITRGGSARGVEAPKKPRAVDPKYGGRLPVKGVRLSACKDHQLAYESNSKGLSQGDFTRALINYLTICDPSLTWHQVILRVAAIMRAENQGIQEPQLEGNGRLPIDLNAAQNTTLNAVITETRPGEYKLNLGFLAGLQQGFLFANQDAQLKVVHLDPYSAWAILESGPEPKIGDLFEPAGLGIHGRKKNLHLDVDPSLQEQFKDLEQQFFERYQAGFQKADSPEQSDWVLRIMSRETYNRFYPDLLTPETSLPILIVVGDSRKRSLLQGPLLSLRYPSQLLSKVTENALGLLLRRDNLLTGLHGNEPLSVGLSITPKLFIPTNLDQPPNANQYLVDGNKVVYRQDPAALSEDSLPKGSLMTFEVANQGVRDQYLYLINCGPDGSCWSVFPSSMHNMEAARIGAGVKRNLEMEHAVIFDKGGLEFLRIITTDKPLDAYSFEIPPLTRIKTREGNGHPLSQFLTSGHRGSAPTVAPSSWTTQLLSWRIDPLSIPGGRP